MNQLKTVAQDAPRPKPPADTGKSALPAHSTTTPQDHPMIKFIEALLDILAPILSVLDRNGKL